MQDPTITLYVILYDEEIAGAATTLASALEISLSAGWEPSDFHQPSWQAVADACEAHPDGVLGVTDIYSLRTVEIALDDAGAIEVRS